MKQLHARARRFKIPDGPPAEMPRNLVPMAATLVKQPFDHPDWLYEIKWDGYRAIGEVAKSGVRFYSRRLRPFDARFRPIVQCLAKFRHEAVLDGELTVLDGNGKAQFQWLQNFPQLGGQLVYYVFDLLYFDGHDLRGLALERRKSILTDILPDLPRVKLCEHVQGDGVALFKATRQMGLEGIVAKYRKSTYRGGQRTNLWRKIKHRHNATVLICGFTKRPAALIVGVRQRNDIRFAGAVEFGFSERKASLLGQALAPLIQDTSPFQKQPYPENGVTWVKPIVSAEVTFQEWTAAGQLRHPAFVGLLIPRRGSDCDNE